MPRDKHREDPRKAKPNTGKAGVSPSRNTRGNPSAEPRRGQPVKPHQPPRPT